MAHDVFLSHSTKDKTVVDAVCASLEGHGIRCWVAPRDIPVGADYASSIIEGINASQVMIVILSSHANASPYVQKEVERAVNKGVIIIPLRIEDIELSKSLEFFLSTSHWFDAFKLQQHNYLEILADRVGQLVSGSTDAPVEQQPTPPAPKADLASEIDGLLNGLDEQIDDEIQDELDEALAGLKLDMQGTGVDQVATPQTPVPAGDGGQLRAGSGRPAERSPHDRSLVHQHEVASFVVPLEHQIEQSASFVFKSEFIQSNSQYKERINAVTLGVRLEDPTVNAYATDDPSPQIIIMGGMARAMRVSAAGLSLHMQLREQGTTPTHLRRLFRHLGDGIIENQGTFPQQVGEELYSECMGEEIDAAFESGTDRFVSLARDFGAVMEMYVIAHEAGHIALGHTLGPTLSYDMSRNQEREADSFASSCLSTSPFRDKLFLGQVFATVILSWMDHAAASDEVSTHPSSHDRFLSALRSNKEAAEDAAEQFGLTTTELQGFLPPTGGA